MRKIIKWTAIMLGVLIGLVMITGVILYAVGKKKLRRAYAGIHVESVGIPSDPEAIARGRHVSIIWACTKCHGDNLGGRVFTKDPVGETIPTFGRIPAANLTSGKGGIGRSFTDMDWIRAIRHGVRPANKPEIFMKVTAISEQDLGDLIAYLKQLPPVDSDSTSLKYGPVIPITSALGIFAPVAGEIDHNATQSANPVPQASAEYGRYLSSICAECHSGSIAKPMKNWSRQDFIRTFQTGLLPNGKRFGPTMSSKTFTEWNEMELSALWLYFQKQ
jgi:cytochrome c553